MAASLIDYLAEEARKLRTGDDRYARIDPYVFVLHGPKALASSQGPNGTAVFPLPVNPQEFNYTLPFACEITPLQESGVVSEEAGIVLGEIALSGTTGWKLRRVRDTSPWPGGGDFSGMLGERGDPGDMISGQLAFWRLTNRCFDAYSALKKDPEAAPKTSMEFHSIKDELHLVVVPRSWELHRNASRERVTYRWSFRGTIIGAAGEVFVPPSPDLGVLQQIKNGIATAKNAIQMITATIQDITAAVDSIRRVIQSIASILSDVAGIVNAFADLVDGTKKFLDIPRAFVGSVTEFLESIGNTARAISSWPADAAQAIYDLVDNLDALQVAGTDYWVKPWQEQVARYERITQQRANRFLGSRVFDDTDTQSTVDQIFGGEERPGDSIRLQKKGRAARFPQYQGIEDRVVGQGDTIQSLAAKHLGDARRWPELVMVNDLRAPYISEARIPGTLQVGGRVAIPTMSPSASPDAITTGQVAAGRSQTEVHLGEDFEVVRLADGTFGWAIDEAGGSVDVRHIRGVANIGQALEMRFRTEQGSNILYPRLGLPRVVGAGETIPVFGNLRYQARVQLLADKRIQKVVRFSLRAEADAVFLDADVQPIGFESTRPISRQIT